MIRIATVGSASTGKSSVANAVFGTAFPVDPRSGSTREVLRTLVGDLEVIDAPPDTAPEADVYLMVCDKDLTATEFRHLRDLRGRRRPVAIVLNKADTYDADQLAGLLRHIQSRVRDFVAPKNVIACAADPVRIVHREHSDGRISEHGVPTQADVESVSSIVRSLTAEAGASLRVRSRELGRRLGTSLRERLREGVSEE
ncbi:MAG TPA: GTPase [Bryobacteraceae bacterium]|nr:GTPase [Bryobacteraceae bacterium]